jgi:hypothetical protein
MLPPTRAQTNKKYEADLLAWRRVKSGQQLGSWWICRRVRIFKTAHQLEAFLILRRPAHACPAYFSAGRLYETGPIGKFTRPIRWKVGGGFLLWRALAMNRTPRRRRRVSGIYRHFPETMGGCEPQLGRSLRSESGIHDRDRRITGSSGQTRHTSKDQIMLRIFRFRMPALRSRARAFRRSARLSEQR